MAIINVYRNLDLDEREIIDAESGKELYKTVDKIDWKNSIIIANGNNVDKDYIIQDDDIISIKQYPSNDYSPLEKFLSVVTLGLYAVGKEIVEAIQKNAIEQMLSSMDKSVSNTRSQTVNLPSVRGASNQNGNGKVTPLSLGHSLFTPFLTGAYNSIGGEDGEDSYYTMLYNLGYKDLSVRQIKMGDFLIASNGEGNIPNGNVTVDGNYRFTSGGENATVIELRDNSNQMDLMPQKVTQDNYNTTLIHTPESAEQGLKENVLILDKFTELNPQKVEVEIDFRNLIAWNDDGNETKATAKIGLAVSYDDGEHWESYGQITGSNSYEVVDNKENKLKIFDMNSTTDTLGVSTITRQKNNTLRFSAIYNVDFARIKQVASRVLLIKIVRYDAQSVDTKIQATPILANIKTWCFDWDKSESTFIPLRPISDRLKDKIVRLAIKVKSTDSVKDQLDKITVELQSKCPIYQNGAWTTNKYATSNPASVIYNIMTHPMLGKNIYTSENVNFDKLGEVYNFCEEKNIKVSGVLTQQQKLSEVISNVLSIARSTLILEDNKYSFWIDKPQNIPVTVLNNHNLLPELSNTKSFEELPDVYLVKFIDSENLWQEGQFYLPITQGVDISDPNTVIESLDLTWITDYQQAVKQTYYYHAVRKLRPETWNRKQGIEGAIVNIGDLVLLQDDTISVGIGDGGEIIDIEVGAGKVIGFTTDSYFNIPSDVTQEYAVTLNSPNGTRTDKVTFEDYYTNHFYFKTPISYNDLVQYTVGDIISFGVYEKVTNKALVMGKKQNEDLTFDLTLVPYQDGIYTADSGIIPPYNPLTTKESPIVNVPTLPYDPKGIQGSKGEDGLTIFIEKSALVFDADSNGVVQGQHIDSRVIIQQKGIDVDFYIGDLQSPNGFSLSKFFHTVKIDVLQGSDMANNGVIQIPINYTPVLSVVEYKDENGNAYKDENGIPYKSIEYGTPRNVDLYISYAKSIKGEQGIQGEKGVQGEQGAEGQRAIKYWGIRENSPTINGDKAIIGDYYLRPSDVRILQFKDIKYEQGKPIAQWNELNPSVEPDLELYRLHINDVTSILANVDKKDAVVSAVNGYFDLLLTNTIFTDNLFSKIITVAGKLIAEKFFNEQGYKTMEGFNLNAKDGSIEANDIAIRGDFSLPGLTVTQNAINTVTIDLVNEDSVSIMNKLEIILNDVNTIHTHVREPLNVQNFITVASGDEKDRVVGNDRLGVAITRTVRHEGNTIRYSYYILGEWGGLRPIIQDDVKVIGEGYLSNRLLMRYKPVEVKTQASVLKAAQIRSTMGYQYLPAYLQYGGVTQKEAEFYDFFKIMDVQRVPRHMLFFFAPSWFCEGVVLKDGGEYLIVCNTLNGARQVPIRQGIQQDVVLEGKKLVDIYI